MNGLHAVAGTADNKRLADVVFVHGLGGDARSTWMRDRDDEATFWPSWLAQDFPGLGVWTLGYAAEASAWKGASMALPDRGQSVLELFVNKGLASRPLIFITHSLGGLLVKQMLQLADTQGVPRWEAVQRATRGIAFIATPHSGAALANFARLVNVILRSTDVLEDLEAHSAQLRTLHGWFLNRFLARPGLAPACRSYAERLPLRPEVWGLKLPAGLVIVNETSAEPNIIGERAIPLDEDHLSICKPTDRDAPLCDSIWAFIRECIEPRP
jgi:predicted alpha/beta hydrolase family esterase